MTPKKGFTLIELLVVIAIIGILASIVLVSLSGARNRAKDARIISSLGQFRTQGEIIRDTDGDYDNVACSVIGTACTCNDSAIDKLCEDISLQGGTLAINVDVTAPTGEAYCAFSTLNSAADTWYCVDSLLTAKNYSGTAPTCTTTDFTCD